MKVSPVLHSPLLVSLACLIVLMAGIVVVVMHLPVAVLTVDHNLVSPVVVVNRHRLQKLLFPKPLLF
jgi:hypothetical protein